jgi:uncharacterized membrane protein
MGKGRMEAFSDGMMAIFITIMVLELKVPRGQGWGPLLPLLPVFLSYLLSFIYLGIYWNNHHHLLHACPRVSGAILWANLHLMFWLSLIPWATGWMGENHFESLSTAGYGVVLLMAALAYWILQTVILRAAGPESVLRAALGQDWKGKASILVYLVGILSAFAAPWVAQACYVLVALVWLVPDLRIERALRAQEHLD